MLLNPKWGVKKKLKSLLPLLNFLLQSSFLGFYFLLSFMVFHFLLFPLFIYGFLFLSVPFFFSFFFCFFVVFHFLLFLFFFSFYGFHFSFFPFLCEFEFKQLGYNVLMNYIIKVVRYLVNYHKFRCQIMNMIFYC